MKIQILLISVVFLLSNNDYVECGTLFDKVKNVLEVFKVGVGPGIDFIKKQTEFSIGKLTDDKFKIKYFCRLTNTELNSAATIQIRKLNADQFEIDFIFPAVNYNADYKINLNVDKNKLGLLPIDDNGKIIGLLDNLHICIQLIKNKDGSSKYSLNDIKVKVGVEKTKFEFKSDKKISIFAYVMNFTINKKIIPLLGILFKYAGDFIMQIVKSYPQLKK